MASQIESLAKQWLSDPDWAKVYKLNVDMLEDYMNTILVAVGVVLLTLKFTMSFGAGDIVCVLTGQWSSLPFRLTIQVSFQVAKVTVEQLTSGCLYVHPPVSQNSCL